MENAAWGEAAVPHNRCMTRKQFHTFLVSSCQASIRHFARPKQDPFGLTTSDYYLIQVLKIPRDELMVLRRDSDGEHVWAPGSPGSMCLCIKWKPIPFTTPPPHLPQLETSMKNITYLITFYIKTLLSRYWFIQEKAQLEATALPS